MRRSIHHGLTLALTGLQPRPGRGGTPPPLRPIPPPTGSNPITSVAGLCACSSGRVAEPVECHDGVAPPHIAPKNARFYSRTIFGSRPASGAVDGPRTGRWES